MPSDALRAAIEASLPCFTDRSERESLWACPSYTTHATGCPFNRRAAVLAAVAPIVEALERRSPVAAWQELATFTAAARDAALEEAADVSEAHSCGRPCSDRGLGPVCGDVIAAAIRALKGRA